MKRYLKHYVILVFVSLTNILLFFNNGNLRCQDKFEYEIVLENIPIRNVVIDRQNRLIFVANNMIQLHNANGALIRNIQLSKEDSESYNPEYFARKIAVDAHSNIYCLSLYIESFISITKYDSSGTFIKRFPASDNMPQRGERIQDILISNGNKIYLTTISHGVGYDRETPVYVYDLECNFLGKVDYDFVDLNGDPFKFDRTPQRRTILNKYKKSSLKQTKQLEKLSEKRFDRWDGNNFTFAGIDGYNNLYITNGKITKKIDDNLKEIKDIQTPLETLEGDGIFCMQINMRVGYDGTLYLFGVRKEKETLKIISPVLIRIKY